MGRSVRCSYSTRYVTTKQGREVRWKEKQHWQGLMAFSHKYVVFRFMMYWWDTETNYEVLWAYIVFPCFPLAFCFVHYCRSILYMHVRASADMRSFDIAFYALHFLLIDVYNSGFVRFPRWYVVQCTFCLDNGVWIIHDLNPSRLLSRRPHVRCRLKSMD